MIFVGRLAIERTEARWEDWGTPDRSTISLAADWLTRLRIKSMKHFYETSNSFCCCWQVLHMNIKKRVKRVGEGG